MGGLIKYSGIITKVCAMRGNLLGEKDFRALSECRDVPSALSYLRSRPAYHDVLEGADGSSDLHREMIERRLMSSLYSDFRSLYKFATPDIKRQMDIFFRHFEIAITKQALRNVANLMSPDIRLGDFEDFFDRRSGLSLEKLNLCDSIPEFMEAISGTEFERLLAPIYASGSRNFSDYEQALDFFYFRSAWSIMQKNMSKKDSEVLMKIYGSEIDLLNISWIARCKNNFSMTPEQIRQILTPLHYKLPDRLVDELINAADMAELTAILSKSAYKNRFAEAKPEDMPAAVYRIIAGIYEQEKKKNRYSPVRIICYLIDKEEEIGRLVRTIEAVRYGVRPGALKPAVNTEKGGAAI